MSKKITALALVFIMLISLGACSSGSAASQVSASSKSSSTASANSAKSTKFKIGMMVQSVSGGGETYRAAERIKKQYPDIVVMATYPDKFTTEQEATISTALSLAADPEIKAIVFCCAVVGTAAAIEKVNEIRPDILTLAAVPGDDIETISNVASIVYHSDVPGMGGQLVQAAHDMGCTTFVHYSFPRHLAFKPTAQRLANMKTKAAELGMTLVEATTPDPTSDAGAAGTQQFILEDVPRKIAQYGKKIAFFGTNTSQAEPLIRSVMQYGVYYMMPADPTPFSGYPSTMGIEIPTDKQGDFQYVMDQISAKLKAANLTGHMGLWKIPLNTLCIQGGFEYALAYCKGQTNGKVDLAKFKECMTKATGAKIEYSSYTGTNGKQLDNFLYLLAEYVQL